MRQHIMTHFDTIRIKPKSYNPFRTESVITTPHGTIHNKDTIIYYFTHRHPEHYFVKFKGFAISLSEYEIAFEHNCSCAIIKYHGKRENILYKWSFAFVKHAQIYDNSGDKQYIIPLEQCDIYAKEDLEQ